MEISPIFSKKSIASVTFAGTELWVDLLSFGPDTASPITNGTKIRMGYLTCIANTKAGTFQVRPNLPTKSAGNLTDTQLIGFEYVDPNDGSKKLDLYEYEALATLVPVGAYSTGVEKLWLRITCGSNAAATFEFCLNWEEY